MVSAYFDCSAFICPPAPTPTPEEGKHIVAALSDLTVVTLVLIGLPLGMENSWGNLEKPYYIYCYLC